VNGRAALDAAAADWPDAVLLDLEMPVMDGYEAAARLREIERTQHRKRCTIVAISSNDGPAIVARALDAGCDHFLAKPAARERLWAILSGAAAPPDAVPASDATNADPVLLDADLESSLAAFLDSRCRALDEMPAALAGGDREAFRRLAHRLAGSFALYGFGWAAARSRALERDALAGDPAALAAGVAALRAHLGGVTIRIEPKRAPRS